MARIVLGCLVLLLCGCSGAAAPTSTNRPTETGSAPSAPKRIVMALPTDTNALATQLVRSGSGTRPGMKELEQLVNAGLTIRDNQGALRPQLAEAVPSVENGLWALFPDGRMQTTWHIREGALWQDGTPLTSEDLLFTIRVGKDRDLPYFRYPALDMVENATAPDSRTLVVEWKQPFIEGDRLYGGVASVQALPLPRHLLEAAYLENKATFTDLSYWSQTFVGSGPYKLREWQLSSYIVLDANDRYVLGRPKIDTIEVRLFTDPSALIAATVADTVDLPLGSRGISYEQAVQLQSQWSGVVGLDPAAPVGFWPQMHNPNPAILSDARFRKALMQSIDRDEMAATLVDGRMPAAHTFIRPGDPEYALLEPQVVKYAFDPRAAGQVIETLGFTRGPDGMFRDPTGARLTLEIRSSALDSLRKAKLTVADYWQRAGVSVNPVDDPESRRSDVEYRATFPSFDTRRGTSGVEDFKFFRSTEARLAESGYVGQNVSNYMSPELDALIDRYLVTIPYGERMQVAGEIVHHLTDQVIPLVTYYDAQPTIVGKRLQNVAIHIAADSTNTWNAQEWDTAP